MTKAANTSTNFGDQLLKILAKVDRPGAVCVSGDLPLTMPGLEVDRVGQIGLPLGAAQARKLIKQCAQAPYGKGTKTIVDTKVRRVWELDPTHFKLANPKWSDLVSSITSNVQQALGLEKSKLTPHLYKLLIYDKGDFFLPHRDGEKLNGMVATLVIALPSPHSGGELIVSHEGRQHQIKFAGAASGHELSYAAFYADCEHEVRPVKDGFRLCLVYNLTLAQGKNKREIAAPCSGPAVDAIRKLLGDWPKKNVHKIAVALDHHYSQVGLKVDMLKGIDRARADVLFDAAEQANCVAHLALVTHWENGAAEGGDYDDYYSSSQRHRYGDWSEDEDEDEDEYYEEYEADDEDAPLSGYVMGDIFEDELSADHWSDGHGETIFIGEVDLDESEIVASQPLAEWAISREEFEGFTGNAGMTLERWYNRAAVIIWPRQNHFQILCSAGTDAAIAGLKVMVETWKRSKKSVEERERQSCLKFAKAIIDSWGPKQFRYSSYQDRDSAQPDRDSVNRSVFPSLLQDLDAPELACRFVAEVMPRDADVQLDRSSPTFFRQHGWKVFESSLIAVVDASSSKTVLRNAELLQLLCLERKLDADRTELCLKLAEHIVTVLTKLDHRLPKNRSLKNTLDEEEDVEEDEDQSLADDWPDDDWQPRTINRFGLLTALAKSLIAVGAKEQLARLIDHTRATGSKYDLTDVHLKTIFGLGDWLSRNLHKPNPVVTRWLKHCRAELEQRTATEPPAPPDFRRAAKLACDCGDCRQVNQFLAAPNESVLRLPLAEARRRHLHQKINSAGSDLTHVTVRKGRPYVLVCTKTTASYKKACQIYLRDCENLKRLLAIEEQIKK